ncbi:MAG: hypothetical protein JXA30_16150 [Deltaproteobacteria bacterium]|nr:hypothetical protein [Deltaproteobacteria bacterium]
MDSEFAPRSKGLLRSAVDLLSFDGAIRSAARQLNRKAEDVDTITPDLLSHPGGFRRSLRKRRIGIAECYLQITQAAAEDDFEKRLHALTTLVDLALHAKTIAMPLNTARVQIELMKRAAKAKDDPRRQMEAIADFSLASYGQETVIRRFLKELGLPEVPDKGHRFRDLDLAWDSHVHDNLSEGRKTPSQVILDAFIKGLSRLTLVHFDASNKNTIYEGLKAGEILGIRVSMGIEFSVGKATRRKHFVFIPPADTPEGFFGFLEANRETLAPFFQALEENRARRQSTITTILQEFNYTDLIDLNQGYTEGSVFAMPPLLLNDLQEIVSFGQFSRNHLSELLYRKLKEVLRRRVIALKTQREVCATMARLNRCGEWELERIEELYRKTRESFVSLNPEDLKNSFFPQKNIRDYDSSISEPDEIFRILKSLDGTLVFIHPLNQGLKEMVHFVLRHHASIDQIELLNMYDSMRRNPQDTLKLCHFVDIVNNGSLKELQTFLNINAIDGVEPLSAQRALEALHVKPLIPVIGSDSTGREPRIPGMGFIKKSSISPESRKGFVDSHYRLPNEVSTLVLSQGRRLADDSVGAASDEIYSVGRKSEPRLNLVGDEETRDPIGPLRFWRYLNRFLKSLIYVGIGLLPAYLWIGAVFAFVWFGLTLLRNIFVDLISGSGFNPKEWRVRNINLDNASQSLFWTGFSVPLLGVVRYGFDLAWPWEQTGPLYEIAKYLFICVANGTYIFSHNTLRRFDPEVARGNFFRSLIAWPLAALFSPIGNALLVPSIVQAKFWSEVVAAAIEGVGKFKRRVVLVNRDLREVLPRIESDKKDVMLTAMLDLLHIWGNKRRGRTALRKHLSSSRHRFSWRPASIETGPGSGLADEQKTKTISSQELDRLIDVFQPLTAQAELSEFIAGRYTIDEALVLSEMLNTHLVSFHLWLMALRKTE